MVFVEALSGIRHVREFAGILALLNRAQQGLAFSASTKEAVALRMKELMDKEPFDALLGLISHAKNLLLQGKSAAELCYAVAFESASYFNKLFKTLVGETLARFARSAAR